MGRCLETIEVHIGKKRTVHSKEKFNSDDQHAFQSMQDEHWYIIHKVEVDVEF